MSTTAKHTPGPWDYVASTEHHGPYVTSEFGSTICDCYVMSNPSERSTANGGNSKPISFLHEMADPNARLIAAAPEMKTALAASTENLRTAADYIAEELGDGTTAAILRDCADANDLTLARAEGRAP